MSRRQVNLPWFTIALLLAVLLGGIVWWDLAPWLRGPGPFPPEWRWLHLPLDGQYPLRQAVHGVLLLCYVAAVMMVMGMGRREDGAGDLDRGRVVAGLLLAALFGVIWPLAQTWVREEHLLDTLIFRVYAPPLNGYFVAPAQVESISHTLHHYLESLPTFYGDRPKTHPPGLFLFYAAFQLLFEGLPELSGRFAAVARTWAIAERDWVLLADPLITSAFTTAWLQVLVAGLTPLPLYGFLGELGQWDNPGQRRFALWAAQLYPLLAAPSLFLLQWDTLYPLLGFAAWYFALRGQNRTSLAEGPVSGRAWWNWVAAGLLLGLLIWLSYGTAVLGAMIGLHLLWRQRGRLTVRGLAALVMGGMGMAGAVIAPWLWAYLAWDMNFFRLLRFGLDSHFEIVTSHRDYQIWWWMNLVDFGLWMGPAPILLALVGTVRLWRAGQGPWHRDLLGMAVIFWGSLLLLNFSGTTRGEIGRLWIFLMPFPLLLSLVAAEERTHAGRLLLLMMGLHGWVLAHALAPFLCC